MFLGFIFKLGVVVAVIFHKFDFINIQPKSSHVVRILVGNSADKLHHPRSVVYFVELVLLNKRQISGGGDCLHCHLLMFKFH